MPDHRTDSDESPSEKTSIAREIHSSSRNHTRSIWKYQRRYFVAFMAFLGFCNVYALRVNLSVAIVAMTTESVSYINGTKTTTPAEFDWSPSIKGLILSSFFYGYIVTQLPAGYLAAKYGGRQIFGVGVAAASILTIFTPIFARSSLYLLLGARVIEGLFEGVAYPAIHAVWSRWAPPLERSKLATIAFSGSYFGTVVALPLSGFIGETLGWPWIFVFFGAVALAWAVCWSWLVSETPSTDKYISDQELDYIRGSLGSAANNVKVVIIKVALVMAHFIFAILGDGFSPQNILFYDYLQHLEVPWKRIFTSFPVWAIIIAHFSENWGFYTLLTELPTFMNDVFGFNPHKGGTLAALPYLAMGIVVQLGGYMADSIRTKGRYTTGRVRKIFNCGGFIFQSVFLLAAAHSSSPVLLILFLTAAVGFGGFAWSGFGVNHLDIAPPYASILMGVSNTFATLPGMISPIVTGQMVTHKTAEEWQVVFYIAAAVYLIGAVFFALFASGDEQPWAQVLTGLLRDDDSSVTEDLPFGEASCD